MKNFIKNIFGLKITKDLAVKVEPIKVPNAIIPTEGSSINCPYCNSEFNKIPTRKSICKNCNEVVFVLKDSDSNKINYLTAKEAEEFKIESKLKSLEKKAISNFERYGLNTGEYHILKDNWFVKIGEKASIPDFLWYVYNYLIDINSTNFRLQSNIYYSMAIYLHNEGKNNFDVLQSHARAKLYFYRQEGFKRVSILTAGKNACKNCQKHDKKVIAISEALEKMPIPCKDCTNERVFCRCSYSHDPIELETFSRH